jgi:hypothetical protein
VFLPDADEAVSIVRSTFASQQEEKTMTDKSTETTSISALFMFERETPGTYRFKEVADEGNNNPFIPVMGTAYVKKFAFKDSGVPKAIRVVITPT